VSGGGLLPSTKQRLLAPGNPHTRRVRVLNGRLPRLGDSSPNPSLPPDKWLKNSETSSFNAHRVRYNCNYCRLKCKAVGTNYVIITSCTSRKRAAGRGVRFGRNTVGGDLRQTAKRWCQEVKSSSRKVPVSQLYLGRSFMDAKWVAAELRAELHVVSAGLGLVSVADDVPSYDLTIAGARSQLQKALEQFDEHSSSWWRLLNEGSGLRGLAERYRRAVILLALPATYLEMVSVDLSSFSPAQLARVRIFTSSAGRRVMPSSLAQYVMPYDERLESIVGCSGTRADFPQRAMRHFVETLHAQQLTLKRSRAVVEFSLSRYSKPARIQRLRVDDDKIKALIRSQWRSAGGRSAMLLRYLRDVAGVACEQSRFAHLCGLVRHEEKRSSGGR
jgi:hypothetical protein